MATDWEGMAHSLIISLMKSDLSIDDKEKILMSALHMSPLARNGGDVSFSEMLISMQLRDPDPLYNFDPRQDND